MKKACIGKARKEDERVKADERVEAVVVVTVMAYPKTGPHADSKTDPQAGAKKLTPKLTPKLPPFANAYPEESAEVKGQLSELTPKLTLQKNIGENNP